MQKARVIAIAGAFAGGLLFAYTLHAAGLIIVLRQIRQIGAGFGVVLLLSGIRMAVRAQAWALCVERLERFTFRDALMAFVIGDAIGNLTPLGPVASESTKAILSRQNLPPLDAVSSVVLENIFYSISVAVMVSVGTLAFLLAFRPTEGPLVVTLGAPRTGLAPPIVNSGGCHFDAPSLQYLPVQFVTPKIAIMCQIVGSSRMASKARISTSVGMHITTSISRLKSMSGQPPK